jgi:RimJ/RimL family protein N-acetyltransferase
MVGHESVTTAGYDRRGDAAKRKAADLVHVPFFPILADETVIIQTIIFNGHVAGSVSSYEDEGKPEVTYWLGKEYWGKGIATWALTAFLTHHNKTRPIYARVAKDNLVSRRVLEKCGFAIIGESRGFANARGQEIEEFLLELVE